jgi:hypothetical protein
MSGSQPATVGELHPLHRNALRHPLILDGFLTASRLAARRRELCLHVLSSFQRTGRSCPRSPSGLSSSGEPYNITNGIRPCQPPSPNLCPTAASPERGVAKPSGIAIASAIAIAIDIDILNGGRATVNARSKAAGGERTEGFSRKKICSQEQIFRQPGRVTLRHTNIRPAHPAVNRLAATAELDTPARARVINASSGR